MGYRGHRGADPIPTDPILQNPEILAGDKLRKVFDKDKVAPCLK
jgi:hypothetical protein